ncbi:phage antirepressor KilAC domain-containing protein [Falcatimonas sp. MSJ-15]|uniref:phage antirepressor n=1 Tax=Falcatimonas sp. MSJ-15 TaxID=2841515 RepID=UPI001C0FAAFC|nr:phage antirepressor KilAC domain-containing protein [Falcatimonas sp. MSJ-15]MBU5469162.1 phage antirepressor KilAC domain-containing protein [Falcatimonas sp. MSJ-15]
MNNNLQIFNSEEFGTIRTVMANNEPWFVGKDVATVLGYSNPRDAINKHVDDEDKGVAKCDTLGGIQDLTIINESGLYSLILSSKMPNAKKFKHWVTSEVLPSIRKNGAYMTEQTIEKALTSPDFLIQLATQLKEEQEARKQAEQIIEQQKSKVVFADAVSASSSSILIGDLAKLICQNGVDIGQKRLFQWLRENGYLIKRKGSDWNMPTQRAVKMGLFEIKESSRLDANGCNVTTKTTKATGKGQVYFINKFLTVAPN